MATKLCVMCGCQGLFPVSITNETHRFLYDPAPVEWHPTRPMCSTCRQLYVDYDRGMNTCRDANTLVLVRGLPGAGKTTLAKDLENVEYEYGLDSVGIVSMDQFRMKEGKYVFDPADTPYVAEKCVEYVVDCMMRKLKRVIVHNTFTRRWEMAGYIRQAYLFDYAVQIIQVNGLWPSEHNVPARTIAAMQVRWENIH